MKTCINIIILTIVSGVILSCRSRGSNFNECEASIDSLEHVFVSLDSVAEELISQCTGNIIYLNLNNNKGVSMDTTLIKTKLAEFKSLFSPLQKFIWFIDGAIIRTFEGKTIYSYDDPQFEEDSEIAFDEFLSFYRAIENPELKDIDKSHYVPFGENKLCVNIYRIHSLKIKLINIKILILEEYFNNLEGAETLKHKRTVFEE
jgi:hypothetical protein